VVGAFHAGLANRSPPRREVFIVHSQLLVQEAAMKEILMGSACFNTTRL